MRLTGAVLLLTRGLVFPLLLNGQTFTNGLLALACTAAGVALALHVARDSRATEAQRRVGRIYAGLGLLFALIVAAQLPSAYRFQSGFNRKVAELRRARAANARPAVQVPPAVR